MRLVVVVTQGQELTQDVERKSLAIAALVDEEVIEVAPQRIGVVPTAPPADWRSGGTLPAGPLGTVSGGRLDAQLTVGRSRPFAGSSERRVVQSSSFWD